MLNHSLQVGLKLIILSTAFIRYESLLKENLFMGNLLTSTLEREITYLLNGRHLHI